ncbi:uncharacterized protein LOC135822788 [Sycon ciliatum]|uniref:uncharacterized protein LOC135822788 n=1 Tax=Sycon ciliatum TaxID=27933 RepID=UPI0031F698D7
MSVAMRSVYLFLKVQFVFQLFQPITSLPITMSHNGDKVSQDVCDAVREDVQNHHNGRHPYYQFTSLEYTVDSTDTTYTIRVQVSDISFIRIQAQKVQNDADKIVLSWAKADAPL